jgi:predicted MPP superfamily phosphohydrolase
MKGPFFINFMIIMSIIAALTIVLWSFLSRSQHKRIIFAAGMAGTLGAVACLAYYGHVFPDFMNTAATRFWLYSSMASLGWLFMFFLALPILLVLLVGYGVYQLAGKFRQRRKNETKETEEAVMSRRTFCKRAVAVIPVLTFGTGMAGTFLGERDLATTVHRLRFPSLPDYLEGYKIGQISDVHMGLFFSPQRLQEAMDALADQGVHRLELTGDLIDELSLLPDFQDVLVKNAARFPDGIDFCYGNHEYYRSFSAITAMLAHTPVRILRNSHIMASPGRGEGLTGRQGSDDRPFYIAGADYSFAKGEAAFTMEREDYVKTAVADIPADAFVVMLAHHPDFIDEAFERGIPLTLCGHTHGAQFAPIGPLVQAIGFKYLRGLYGRPGCYGYVNRGTGHWLPFRIGCSREVSVFELTRSM